jgi:hypothetical protein
MYCDPGQLIAAPAVFYTSATHWGARLCQSLQPERLTKFRNPKGRQGVLSIRAVSPTLIARADEVIE